MEGLEQGDWDAVLLRCQAAPQDDFPPTKSPWNYCEISTACSGKSNHATFTQYSVTKPASDRQPHKTTCLLPQTSSPQWLVISPHYEPFDIISFGVSDCRARKKPLDGQTGIFWHLFVEKEDSLIRLNQAELTKATLRTGVFPVTCLHVNG